MYDFDFGRGQIFVADQGNIFRYKLSDATYLGKLVALSEIKSQLPANEPFNPKYSQVQVRSTDDYVAFGWKYVSNGFSYKTFKFARVTNSVWVTEMVKAEKVATSSQPEESIESWDVDQNILILGRVGAINPNSPTNYGLISFFDIP